MPRKPKVFCPYCGNRMRFEIIAKDEWCAFRCRLCGALSPEAKDRNEAREKALESARTEDDA